MKTTIVPAQITTVEDKVAGNLGFTQLLLLTTPVFLDGALFVLLPPFLKVTAFKLVICAILALLCMSLAIRIKGTILLNWVMIISRYNVRPRMYIFNKNDSYLRSNHDIDESSEKKAQEVISDTSDEPVLIPTFELVRLETAVSDPRAKFHFKTTRKGALRVYIHEVKKEAV